jgi:hypothetical protein
VILEALFDADDPAVPRRVIDAALGGNLDAAKMVLDRIVPSTRKQTRQILLTGGLSVG